MNRPAAIGVIAWGANPIKLHADMGLLSMPTHFLPKPPALQRSADATASVELARETA